MAGADDPPVHSLAVLYCPLPQHSCTSASLDEKETWAASEEEWAWLADFGRGKGRGTIAGV